MREFFFFVFLARALFYGARRKNKPVKIAKNDFRYPLEPRYIEGPRDLGFVISRSFSICVTITREKKIVHRLFEVPL